LVDQDAVDVDLAVADLLQAGDAPQQSGFAAARGADEDQELAVVDLQVQAQEHRHVAIGFFQRFDLQVAHLLVSE